MVQLGMGKKISIDEFLIRANNKHGERYEIDSSTFKNMRTKMRFICKDHGEFFQIPSDFLKTGGCAKCAGVKRKTTEQFIEEANIKHNHFYNYSSTNYKNAFTPVSINCPIHGDFKQSPHDHLRGHGCSSCGIDRRANSHKLDFGRWQDKATEVWGNRYQYTDTYTGHKELVDIICKNHGKFTTTPDAHIYGNVGCPECAPLGRSSAEIEIYDYVNNLLKNVDVIHSDRVILNGKELDIYIPSKKIAIEYNGLYWHSELFVDKFYHMNKFNMCAEKDIRLIQIFEDEWKYNKELVKNKLCYILGLNNKEKIFARKTSILEVSTEEKNKFYNKNHIQGTANSTNNIGLYINNELVACMSFLHIKNKVYLVRYATSKQVVGGFSKLLKYYVNIKNKEIISFADLRWSSGELYLLNGWVLDTIIPPDYSYIVNNKRKHKFGMRKKLLSNILGDKYIKTHSEHKNCFNNNIYRVYDSGKLRLIYNK